MKSSRSVSTNDILLASLVSDETETERAGVNGCVAPSVPLSIITSESSRLGQIGEDEIGGKLFHGSCEDGELNIGLL